MRGVYGTRPSDLQRPDADEKSGQLGVLGACSVCRSIASGTCTKCRAAICDTVCLDAHRKIDHPRLQEVVIEPFRCKRCNKGITFREGDDKRTTYCSERCRTLGSLSRARRAQGKVA